ncbi:hypothetical protein [Halobacterium sp. R2-5]|uniref:DUF7119 family protein n=1 Tax=Halobacterium sp. R2-5 TaxID=2715751 RepID=UPI0014225282|nr:hypothetical protein [Halobacterium sp. R2-5]NIB98311.1 hypothetical protein [Halobacterium sp. R2-5]
MTDEEPIPPTDRESPVGEPVVRGDERVTGEHAREAVSFDPDDPESVAEAAETVGAFARNELGDSHLYMLRGAAACAALVRAENSYKAAAERADGDVGVSFIRKWARVHDLPRAVREHVAAGHIPPTAAKHIARVGGDDRYLLAWAVVDNELTVRDVRRAASAVNDGDDLDDVLEELGVTPGALTVTLPAPVYRDLRRQATVSDRDPDDVVADALREYL